MYFGSHGAIAPFNLYQPDSAREAATLYQETGGDFLGGGVDLVPALRSGSSVSNIIALGGVTDLKQISVGEDQLTLGAGVTWAQLQKSTEVRTHFPELVSLLHGVANVRIRAAATLGGNIATGKPAYDALPLLHAAGAQLMIDGGDGPALQSSEAGFTEDLPSGLLHSIQLPIRHDHILLMDRSRKPVTAVYVGLWQENESGGTTVKATLSIGCAYSRFVSLTVSLDGLAGTKDIAGNAAEIASQLVTQLPEPQSDHHASGAYRKRLIPIQVRRLLEAMRNEQ